MTYAVSGGTLNPTHSLTHHHTSHDSVSVVRTTFKVYGKCKFFLTLSQPKTPEPIVTKFEWRDNVVDSYHQKNLGSVRSGVFAPDIGEIYPLLFEIYYTFLVLQLAYGRVRLTDFYA